MGMYFYLNNCYFVFIDFGLFQARSQQQKSSLYSNHLRSIALYGY